MNVGVNQHVIRVDFGVNVGVNVGVNLGMNKGCERGCASLGVNMVFN